MFQVLHDGSPRESHLFTHSLPFGFLPAPHPSTFVFFLEDHFVPHRSVKLSADTGALVADVSFDDTNKGKNFCEWRVQVSFLHVPFENALTDVDRYPLVVPCVFVTPCLNSSPNEPQISRFRSPMRDASENWGLLSRGKASPTNV